MSNISYDPWALLGQIRNELNRWPEGYGRNREGSDVVTSDWSPAVDIIERPDCFLILADVPGIDPKDIEINMENGVLSLKGSRFPREEDRKGYKRSERAQGGFYRRFSMPDSADASKVSARSRLGVLEINIPKQEKVHPRRIDVASEE